MDNPLAFPHYGSDDKNPAPGMTLRDYFAAHAMQGLVAGSGDQYGQVEYRDLAVARSAYEMADAMLAERAKAGTK